MSAVYSPSVAAIVVSAFYGRAALSDLFARLFRWRIGLVWYVAPVIGIWALSLAAALLSTALFGTTPPAFPAVAQWPSLVWLGLTAFLIDPGPLGEELGWRGFALPRLLERFNGLSAALILGTIWGIWHLPAFFLSGMPQSQFSFGTFLVSIVAASVIITYVVNRSGGSVLPAILVHWSNNRFADSTPPTATATAIMFVAGALFCVLIGGLGLGRGRALSSGVAPAPSVP
jgi:membrane protease YdiL (CAAX protease family)